MVPEQIISIEDPDTSVLFEKKFFPGRDPAFWIQSGIGAIEFTEDGLRALTEILDQYWREEDAY